MQIKKLREDSAYRKPVFVPPGHSGLASRTIFYGFARFLLSIEESPRRRKFLTGVFFGLPVLSMLLLCVTPVDPLLVFISHGYERPSIIYGYDGQGKPVPIAEFYRFSRRVIDLSNEEATSARVVRSFIATEDNNFYSFWHWGVDPQGILRASMVNMMAGEVKEGASTITQQVARLRFLSNERTALRKIREAFLAVLLELRYRKKSILEMYLNEVPLGHGTLGVEAAADFYFGKSHKDLSWGESALLASLTTRPRDFSPLSNPNGSRRKVRIVLRKLVETGTISVEEAQNAWADLEEHFYAELNRSPNDTAFNRRMNDFPYVSEFVKKSIPEEFEDRLYSGGLQIQTTIVVDHQKAAEETMIPWLGRLTEQRRRKPFRNFFAFDDEFGPVVPLIQEFFDPGEFRVKKSRLLVEFEREFLPMRMDLTLLNLTGGEDRMGVALDRSMVDSALEEDQGVEGSLISMRPDTGAITAVVGGSGFTSQNQLLRFLTAKRQPGSSFKPIIYASGIEETGLHPGTEKPLTAATVLDDSPVQFVSADLSEYSPENFSATYEGQIRLRKALRLSKNAVAIRVYERLGANRINPTAEKILGFDQTGKHLPREATVALGSVEMTPLEMARAYSVFASGGLEVKPFLIESIKDSDGATLFEHKVEAGRRVLSVGATEIITSMMQDVIKEGTGTAAAIGRPAAGKTGTTNRSTDAWFIGFTPQLVTAVQIGYDSNRTLGSSGTGGAIAAPVWGDYMRRALRHEPVRAFEFPESNVRRVEVCEDTGLLPASSCDTIVELFLPGTEPKTSADSRRSSDSDRQEVKRTREDIFTDKDF